MPKRAIEAVTTVRDFQNDVAKAVSNAYQAMEELLADKYKNQEWEKRRGDFPLVEKLAKNTRPFWNSSKNMCLTRFTRQ